MAKICLICEGSYPYVVGGVSSWIHDLIKSNPEHEFVIVSIAPNDPAFFDVKYPKLDNLIEIENIIIDKNFKLSHLQILKNNFNMKKTFVEKLSKILFFKEMNSEDFISVMNTFYEKKYGNPLEIFMSKSMWNALYKNYEKNFARVEFKEFYWTYRNVLLNLIDITQYKIPEADIYHPVAAGYSGYIGALAKFRGQGKLVITEHGMYPREREEEILDATWVVDGLKPLWIDFFYGLSKILYDYSDKIITLFDYNHKFQIECGANPDISSVIPNGIDCVAFGAIEREPKKHFCVGSVLRVVPIKDVKMMIEGFKCAYDKIQDMHLYLIGPTDENKEYYEECKQLVKDLEMEEAITFTGRANVKEYFKFIDIMLLTSISEGQPLSILEGLAAKIPFIATNVGNCQEMLLEKYDIGIAGTVISPTDYVACGDEIIKYYLNRDLIKLHGENGQKIVEKYYNKTAFVEGYKAVYKELSEVK